MGKLYETLQTDFKFQDSRGSLTQLVHIGYEQVNVVTSNAGVTRGGHYHKKSREAFFVVSGCVKVSLSRGQDHEECVFGEGEFFLIPPGTMHSMFYPEHCVLVAMYDHCVELENGEKDIHTDCLDGCGIPAGQNKEENGYVEYPAYEQQYSGRGYRDADQFSTDIESVYERAKGSGVREGMENVDEPAPGGGV